MLLLKSLAISQNSSAKCCIIAPRAGLLMCVCWRLFPYLLWWEFSFYKGFRALNRNLVKKIVIYIFLSQIKLWFRTWTKSWAVVWYEILWPDPTINLHLKQNIFYEIWSIRSSPSVEWSQATHHWPGERRHVEWVMWCVGITWFSALYFV